MFKGLKSLLAGLIAGTAIGILFAPKKGGEIRKSFKKEFSDGGYGLDTLKDTIEEVGKDMKMSYDDIYEELKKNKKFCKAEREMKKHIRFCKNKAREIIDENIPKETREKAKKGLKKAEKSAKRAVKKAKKAAEQVAKKVKDQKK